MTAAKGPDMHVHWYSVSRTGIATLCTGEDDARQTAAESDILHPHHAPHSAVLMAAVGTAAETEIKRLRGLLEQAAVDRRF